MKVIFQYRSKKDKANLEARLAFTRNKKQVSFYTKTRIEVDKDFWDKVNGYVYKKKTDDNGNVVKDKKGNVIYIHDRKNTKYGKPINFKDVDKDNAKIALEGNMNKLKKFIEENFYKASLDDINKDWLEKTVSEYYNPTKEKKQAPEYLLDYYNYYLELKGHEIKEKIRTWQKWITVRNKLERMQQSLGEKHKVKDVNEDFIKDWIDYCKSENYSNQTTKKEFSYIKTICLHAKTKKVEVSPELERLKVKLENTEAPKVYLTIDELKKIKAVEGLPPYLDNVRDWLLISCYTGQRISDFMRFNKSMLRTSKGKTFLDLKQVKTGKDVTVPILPMVLEILEKRNGDFPKPISDQRYNDYIKEVAKRAGLSKMTEGGIRQNNRKVVDKYPKWQLVTSHIGRKSFATNYYGKIPTTFLKDITGHGSEAMLLAYIGKTSKDTAFESYDLLMKATI